MSDMETITKRYLSRNTADALVIAERDGAVTVIERDRRRWTIVSGDAVPDPLASLVAEGLAESVQEPIPWGDEPGEGRVYTGADVDAVIRELKGDH